MELPKYTFEWTFFPGIPNWYNKYYRPSNRIDPLTTHNFGEQGIPKFLDVLTCEIWCFLSFSYSPDFDVFWHFFSGKYTQATWILFSFILHRPVCQNRCAHDIIPFQKWCDQNLRSVLETSTFDRGPPKIDMTTSLDPAYGACVRWLTRGPNLWKSCAEAVCMLDP